jgi:hypothetical protein
MKWYLVIHVCYGLMFHQVCNNTPVYGDERLYGYKNWYQCQKAHYGYDKQYLIPYISSCRIK